MNGNNSPSSASRFQRHSRSALIVCITALVAGLLGGGWALARPGGLLGQKSLPSVTRHAKRHGVNHVGVSDRFPVTHPRHTHHEARPPSEPEPLPPEEEVSEGTPVESGEPETPEAEEPTAPEEAEELPVEEPEPVEELPVEEPEEPTTEEPEAEPPPDTTPPQTTIDSGPASTTTETSATLSFSASESGSSFACKLDGGGWAACNPPKSYSSLGLGSHTFSVRATDLAGNTDATPATRSWTVEEAVAANAHCYSSPHTCGYPDETNTGASGSLAPSGSITVSTNGAVVKDKEVSGKITINASNVTIENVKVVQTASGSGTQAISNNGSGNVIRNVTAGGKGTGSSTIEAAVRGFQGVTLERDYFYNCNECMQGGGTVKDSYMVVSSIYSGAHAEDIYVCSDTITVEHSTLINSVNQTATVFGDTICGGGNKYTVKNSLLAGSGYVFYPQANNTNPSGAQTTIVGNHIARCLGAPETKENGHWYCKGGSDSSGIYPYGGSYGIGAYFSGPTTWSGNVWDDNLATISEP